MNGISIALKYKQGLILPNLNTTPDNLSQAASLAVEFIQLGFVPTNELMRGLACVDASAFGKLKEIVIPILKEKVGADVVYRPMYPNFPQQVMEASDAELFFNAIIHYWTGGEWMPEYIRTPRPIDFERVELKTLGFVTDADFKEIFTNILSSNDSLSAGDKSTVGWFMDKMNGLVYPDIIPFRENMAYVAHKLLMKGKSIDHLVMTATDVLRIVTAMNGGDISLAENTKFKSLPRPTRRLLTKALENVINEEDINRHRGKWIKLFHNLHVGEYSKKVFDIAKKVRENQKIATFNGKVQLHIDNKDILKAIQLLSTRPSEFARRLDHLIRLDSSKSHLVELGFKKVVADVPTRILLQVLGNLKSRVDDKDKRIVFPKGNVQKAILVPGTIPAMNSKVHAELVAIITTALLFRFKEMEPMGKVWIDPALDNCPLPTQQRSASEGLIQVARGTRLPIGDNDTLRFFIYWVGQDIDLSATFYDENLHQKGQVSYTHLRSDNFKAYHSGDITRAYDGASEFIDITIPQAAKRARYIAMNVLVYSGPSFAEHDKVYAGWMTRSKPNSNEIYDPKTVQQKIDLTSNSKNAIPVIFDLVTREAIWTDLTTNRRGYYGGNNVESNRASINDTLEAIVHTIDNKISLGELFTLHAVARGELVENKEEADIIFSPYEGITPHHITEINSEYLK